MADGSGCSSALHTADITLPLLVDLFAGGGGASEGLERAYGVPVDIAINHKPIAISVHQVNHPATKHYISDVYEVCPREASKGRPVFHCHASPDCTHHSVAKAGQPRDSKSRSLTWVVRKWAGTVGPTVITLENVQAVLQWGPLVAKRCAQTGRVVKRDGSVAAKGEYVPLRKQFLVPCPKRRGQTWRQFVRAMNELGYVIDWRTLSACDYGVPTIRKRLYAVARRDSLSIQWPSPTHADPESDAARSGQLQPWRAAAECIDFERECHSIFMASADAKKLRIKRPLADATLRRVAKSVLRYVLETATPYIVPLRGTSASHTSTHPVGNPLGTVSAGGTHHGLVMPSMLDGEALMAANIIKFRGDSKGSSAGTPLPTVTSGAGAARPAGAAHALGLVQTSLSPVIRTAHLEQANTGVVGHDVREPMSTVTTTGSQQRLVMTTMSADGVPVRAAQVYRFLRRYLSEKDLAAISHCMFPDPDDAATGYVAIEQDGAQLVMGDIGMRMLAPIELQRCQGFPDDYVLDRDHHGKPVPQHSQVALIGNSVCSGVLEAIVRANCGDMIERFASSQARIPPRMFDKLAA